MPKYQRSDEEGVDEVEINDDDDDATFEEEEEEDVDEDMETHVDDEE